jgi:hypothetical protein
MISSFWDVIEGIFRDDKGGFYVDNKLIKGGY